MLIAMTDIAAVLLGARSGGRDAGRAGRPVPKPLHCAADGITKSLSGQIDVWFELAVLAGFALVTMTLGTWRLPWREDRWPPVGMPAPRRRDTRSAARRLPAVGVAAPPSRSAPWCCLLVTDQRHQNGQYGKRRRGTSPEPGPPLDSFGPDPACYELMKATKAIGAVTGGGAGIIVGAKIGSAMGIAAAGTAVAATVPVAIVGCAVGVPVGMFGAFVVRTVKKRLDERWG